MTRNVTTDVVVAMDVGGTRIKCALLDASGALRYRERHPTDAHHGQERVVSSTVAIAGALVDRARVQGWVPRAVGVVIPGVVDEATGIARQAANVPWNDVPLRNLIAAELAMPTVLGHDVRAGALAEARLGAGQHVADMLFVPIGTGIAAAYVASGTVLSGAGAAGELGHVVVRPGGPRCGCGASGCLEAIASAGAITRRTGLAASEVATRVMAGDEAAAIVWREVVSALADGLLVAQALLDPQIIVLGGGLSLAGDALLTPLRAAVQDRLTFHREPQIRSAAYGDEAACLGAGLMALQSWQDVRQ